MFPPRRILAPIDFSSASDRAVDLALDVARTLDAELVIAHVYTLPTALYGGALFWPSDDYRRAADDELDKVVARARARYPKVGKLLAQGDPRQKILAIAEGSDIDLIVMGTQGLRGLAHALIGSVTEHVLRAARVPVLTVSDEGVTRRERRAGARDARPPSA